MLSAAAQLGSPPDPQLTNLTAWFERIGSRPAVQQDTAEMLAFVAGLQ